MFRSGICPRTTCGGTEGWALALENGTPQPSQDSSMAFQPTLLVIVPCCCGGARLRVNHGSKERCLSGHRE
ncbi:hypothetical protein ZWY2020_059802 [Hordeum vulgare]|nr:hypothetical protein ZWY2020_059802 [Hordeum vulgare]